MKANKKMNPKSTAIVTLLLLASISMILVNCSHFSKEKAVTLEAGFLNPPESAKPRVWWHWMNGNITKEGIKADLLWMKRVGLGGFQNFDASLSTPQIVPKRLVYMTPEWKDAFFYTTKLADSLGLEMAIAGSPGWSGWFRSGAQLWLDLGSVKNLAEVIVNGQSLGIIWKTPFRVNVTGALKEGANTIEVKVTNLWVNRLTGDQQPGNLKKISYTTEAFYQADSPLLPSGLLGPVKIISASSN